MTRASGKRPPAIYPGSFDPVTLGHVDVVRRAARIFGSVVVAVLKNTAKEPAFSAEERRAMIEESLAEIGGVPGCRVVAFDGLLVDFAKEVGTSTVVRGLRAMSDFEYELQMAQMNRRLDKDLETVFLTPDESLASISSRLVREIAQLGGDVSELVPKAVGQRLAARYGRRKEDAR